MDSDPGGVRIRRSGGRGPCCPGTELESQLRDLGPRAVAAAVRRVAIRLDPDSALKRSGLARRARRVWTRPAPDTMTMCPVVSRSSRVSPPTRPWTAPRVLCSPAIEEPAEVRGHGPVPAGLARDLVADCSPTRSTGGSPPSTPVAAASTARSPGSCVPGTRCVVPPHVSTDRPSRSPRATPRRRSDQWGQRARVVRDVLLHQGSPELDARRDPGPGTRWEATTTVDLVHHPHRAHLRIPATTSARSRPQPATPTGTGVRCPPAGRGRSGLSTPPEVRGRARPDQPAHRTTATVNGV